MRKIKLIFGTHNTLPHGLGEEEFEKAYQLSYKPFLTTLYNYPEMPITLHYSGILLEWFESHHPEFLMLLNDMVRRKQVELLGGGYYQPAFPLVPGSDRLGQIETLTTTLRKRFGKRPRGIWIPELIWEPSLPVPLRTSGMDFTFLDESQFSQAGCGKGDMNMPCITEDQGKSVIVYPISGGILQDIPGSQPREILERIISLRHPNEERVVVFIWRGELHYSEKGIKLLSWVDSFLELLRTNKDKVTTVLPGEFHKTCGPLKKLYFPCTGYSEQIERENSEPEKIVVRDDASPNTPANGFFRQFLSRYEESNLLYCKMMHIHILVNQIRADKSRKKTARNDLWRGQGNSAFWHGVSAGLYQNRIRKAAYSALIESEKTTRERGIFRTALSPGDFDMDGVLEYLYNGQYINAYVHLRGGVLFELDHLPSAWNYLDTMRRYKEDYHSQIKEPVPFDRYPRRGFIDHFFHSSNTVQNFDRMQYQEMGSFIDANYLLEELDRDHKEVTLRSDGLVIQKGNAIPVSIRKTYSFKRSTVSLEYEIRHFSKERESYIFGSEINLSFAGNTDEDAAVEIQGEKPRRNFLKEPLSIDSTKEINIEDKYNRTRLNLSSAITFQLWCTPVVTYTRLHQAQRKDYQSSCFIPRWRFNLLPGEVWRNTLTLRIDKK